MSRAPDETPRRPPRRPSESRRKPGTPPRSSPASDEEPTTFRPSPAAGKRDPAPPRRPAEDIDPPLDQEPRARELRPNPAAAGDEAADSTRRALVERIVKGRVTSGQLGQFSRQFGTYLDSGVNLTKALESLSRQFQNSAMGPVAERMSKAIRRGETLTEAARRESQAFDGLYLSMLRVAEERGGLPETLKSLASHLDARQRLIRQSRSALIYPTAVILVTLAVGGLLTIVVLPKLVDILRDVTRGRSIELPLPTRMLMALSDFIQAYGWWLIPLAVAGLGFGMARAYRTPRGKALLDEVALRMPVMGKLLRAIDTARFARTLSDLLLAGVPVRTSLDLTADALTLDPFRESVRAMKAHVRRGSELGDAILDSDRFEPDVHAFIETGEETGTLPESLGRLAREYEERVTFMVKNLGSLIQPLIVITLGVIVGFIALAFIMAYIAVIASLASGL